ncbi:MAG: ferrous iron transport protein A [Candidatus Kapaibacterium sp.]
MSSLKDAPANTRLRVQNIDAGNEAKRRLRMLGIHVDDVLIKRRLNRMGPVLVEYAAGDSSKIAIGRGLAKKIIVEFEE